MTRFSAGKKHRGCMGIDALDRGAAMGRGVGEQREDRLLALAVIHALRALCRAVIDFAAVRPVTSQASETHGL